MTYTLKLITTLNKLTKYYKLALKHKKLCNKTKRTFTSNCER